MEHSLEIVATRTLDGSLVWRCTKCKKVALGLIGACKASDWPRGRRRKVTRSRFAVRPA